MSIASAEHTALDDEIDNYEDRDQHHADAKEDPENGLLRVGDASPARRTLLTTCAED